MSLSRLLPALTACALLTTPAASVLPLRAAATATGSGTAVTVTFAQTGVTVVEGERFTLLSEVRNAGPAPTGDLLAHINVVSLTSDVYVDPEDWSTSRTRELGRLSPDSAVAVPWEIQAVNAGTFDVYAVILPVAAVPDVPLVASPPVHVRVRERETRSGAGSLPVVLVTPLLLALWALGLGYRARRSSRG